MNNIEKDQSIKNAQRRVIRNQVQLFTAGAMTLGPAMTAKISSRRPNPFASRQTSTMKMNTSSKAKIPMAKSNNDMMPSHQYIHTMNDGSISFNMNPESDQSFVTDSVLGFATPYEKVSYDGSKALKMEQSINNQKVLKNMVLQQQVSAAMSDVKTTPFAPILKEKIEESVKGMSQSKITLGNYLKNSLKSAQLDGELRYRVKNQSEAPPVNDNYLDDYFQSPLSAIRPKASRSRLSQVAMYAHPVGREPEPQTNKLGNQFFKGSMLAMMLAAVVLTGFPDDAMAARGGGGGRSGGRVGGRAFSSAPRPNMSRPSAAPRGGGGTTTINRGPTVIFGSPGYGGYGRGFGYGGMGYGGGFGMYGMGPFGYGYNPGLSIGLTIADVVIQEQRRQQYLQVQLQQQRALGENTAQITQLQNELTAQNTRLALINQQAQNGGANKKYDENVMKTVESQIEKLQGEYKADMDKGDFAGALKVKQEAELLLAPN